MPPPPALRHRSLPSQLKFRQYLNSPAPQGNRPAACATEDGPERPLAKAARVLPSGRGSSLSRAEPPPPPPAPPPRQRAGEPRRQPPTEPLPPSPGNLPGERRAARLRGKFGGKPVPSERPRRPPAPAAPAGRAPGSGRGGRGADGGGGAGLRARGGAESPCGCHGRLPLPQPPLNTMGRQ